MALTAEERDAQIDANEIVRQYDEGMFRMLSMKEDIELAGAKREVAFLATIEAQRAEIERLTRECAMATALLQVRIDEEDL